MPNGRHRTVGKKRKRQKAVRITMGEIKSPQCRGRAKTDPV
jgi:hypothetical protein